MISFALQKKLREMITSKSTLLWLEGAKHERVLKIKLCRNKIILNLANGTTRMIPFDRYACTSVGLQFWYQGKPGVLYKWEQVKNLDDTEHETSPEDDPPPPNLAA
jgi:hypothetical protein